MISWQNIVSGLSVVVAILALVYAALGHRREMNKEVALDATQLTRIETTLGSVQNGVDEIRIDMRSQQRQINELSERTARVEESTKSAHHRLDQMAAERQKGD
jgi:wobble nucleotide-excising tRNase